MLFVCLKRFFVLEFCGVQIAQFFCCLTTKVKYFYTESFVIRYFCRVLGGLAILATEFLWARRLLGRLRDGAKRVLRRPNTEKET